MPITPYLREQSFDPETVRAMGTAMDAVCERMSLSRTPHDKVAVLVASKIIALAQRGERNPDTLCRRVLEEFIVEG